MKRWSFAALAAALIAVACSPDDFVEYALPGIDDGASDGVKKSLQTDGSEEQVITLKTGATLTVPKDAVDHMVTLSMERPSDKAALQLVKSVHSLSGMSSAPYVLTPHGTKFKGPVRIELPVSKDTQKKLVVAWLENEDDGEWKKLGTPTVKDGVAKIEIDHFSVVMLLEEDKSGFAKDEVATDAGVGSDAGSTPTAADPRKDAGAGSGGTTTVPAALADAGTAMTSDPGDSGTSGDAASLPAKDAGTSNEAGGQVADAAAGAVDASGTAPPDAATSDASQPLDASDDDAGFDAGAAKDSGKAGFDGALADAG